MYINYSSDKGLMSQIYKEYKKIKPKRINNPINNWTNESKDSSQKKYKQS
jgi:hypothetical protein